MLLKKQEKEYKRALALMREGMRLRRQRNGIEAIRLEKPIQHGFKRELEFREDVKRKKDFSMIQEAFNFLGQTVVYHKTEDFLVNIGKTVIEKHAYINTLEDPRVKFYWNEEKRKEDLDKIMGYKKYLILHDSVYGCECMQHVITKWRRKFTSHYYFRAPWMLQEVTKPHFLTHYTPIDGELESRLKKIDKEMEVNNYYNLFFSRRGSWDKIFNEKQLKLKYGDGVIYHDLSFDMEEEYE